MSNRLLKEKSPYLLQHAHNPVDWFPWSDEAFETAAKEDKPIFLSIGYSTCHWCHVMEKESFEDSEVAEIMNENYISIKLDREERPDIDAVYMDVCQMLNGSGGWPLSIFMTPDKKPFYAGTYFPKESGYGHTGFKELLLKIDDLWKNDRQKLIDATKEIVKNLNFQKNSNSSHDLNSRVFHFAYQVFVSTFDEVHGGFGNVPKFPMPHNILFLLRYYHYFHEEKDLEMVEKTLTKMRKGGMFDQIGFGFHRYSTDEKWLVPHFEKMLYDQALLSFAYTEAYQLTGNDFYKKTACEILSYVEREMLAPEGGFYSAEDADSEGTEGKYYLWKIEEIERMLGKDTEFFIDLFNIRKEGNFSDRFNPSGNKENILHLKRPVNEDEKEKIRKLSTILLSERNKRIHPHRDDKVLTDWNGLMIAAFARASSVFRNENYIKIAKDSAGFIINTMQKPDGSLYHRYRDGEAAIEGFLDDYAFFAYGLLELYEATFDITYLQKSIELTDFMITHFADHESGGFFFTSDSGEELILRKKEIYDGAIPSGNSITLGNLLKLATVTDKSIYSETAQNLMKAFSQKISIMPSIYPQFLCSLFPLFHGSTEIVIVGEKDDEKTIEGLKTFRGLFIPGKILILKQLGDNEIAKIAKFAEPYKQIDGKTTFYLCQNHICEKPTTEVEEVLADMEKCKEILSNSQYIKT